MNWCLEKKSLIKVCCPYKQVAIEAYRNYENVWDHLGKGRREIGPYLLELHPLRVKIRKRQQRRLIR